MNRFQRKNCTHCNDVMWLRSGTWDTWDETAEMFLPHQCEGVKAEQKADSDAKMAKIVPAWTAALENWDERYGG